MYASTSSPSLDSLSLSLSQRSLERGVVREERLADDDEEEGVEADYEGTLHADVSSQSTYCICIQ